MSTKIYYCKHCEKNSTNRFVIIGHSAQCKGNKKNINKIKCNWCNKVFYDKVLHEEHLVNCSKRNISIYKKRKRCAKKYNIKHFCKFCNKEFNSGVVLGGHTTYCILNPNRTETIKKISLFKKGSKHSEESKQRMSKSRTKYLIEHPDQVPYLLNHSSKKSYPEMLFENALIKYNINGWFYNYQHSIYCYDFAFPNIKLDVEIDGQTHDTEKVKKIDKRRDEFSVSKGWKVLRFKAQEVKTNIEACINKLNETILCLRPDSNGQPIT